MLHFDLIDQDILAPSFGVTIEKERGRNGAEEEHVEEDEEQEECLEVLGDGEGQQLIIGKGIIATCDIHDEDHVTQTLIIIGEGVWGCGVWHLYENVSHQSKQEYHNALKYYEDQELLVGRY